MRKKFLATLFYSLYLILLGQGCSALKTGDDGFLISLPKLNLPSEVALPDPPPLVTTDVKSTEQEVSELTEVKAPFEPALSKVLESKKEPSVLPSEATYKESQYRMPTNTPSEKELFDPQNKVVSEEGAPIKVLSEFNPAPIMKKINIAPKFKLIKEAAAQKRDGANTAVKRDENSSSAEERNEYDLDSKPGFAHFGFEEVSNPELLSTAWMRNIDSEIESRMAQIKSLPLEKKVAGTGSPTQGVTHLSPRNIIGGQQDLSDTVNKKESSLVKNDELVFLDYSKKEGERDQGLGTINKAEAQQPISDPLISSSVSQVIRREMTQGGGRGKASNLLAMASPVKAGSSTLNSIAQAIGTSNPSRVKKKSSNQNQATLYAIEADLKEGFSREVTNFDFVPSHDSNVSLRDFNEGSITIDYSLLNQTGLLRGTILKNHYIRTTFEVPLGGEYSKFEIPLIPKDSLGDYLDDHKLDGYGGYFLVDLGDLIEDVDVEKTSNDRNSPYEHRVLLNDQFKPVKLGSDYRYVLFIGVTPGSLNVRYLGVNGQETSKLTFIAADEMSYDFSQIERPHLLSFSTKVRNTLGMSSSPLDLSAGSITSFLDEKNPVKTSESSYEIKIPWSVKGMRNYFSFAYLSDNIFVGMDRDQEVELPSKEFIGEILRSFNMDSLGAECVLQINLSGEVADLQIQAESERGPANFDHTYLDRDGVFTPELSPLSQKYFAIGYEEGIFSIKITYQDGKHDYLRTYCSPSTYLLEQL